MKTLLWLGAAIALFFIPLFVETGDSVLLAFWGTSAVCGIVFLARLFSGLHGLVHTAANCFGDCARHGTAFVSHDFGLVDTTIEDFELAQIEAEMESLDVEMMAIDAEMADLLAAYPID